MIKLYNLLLTIFSPLICIYIEYRKKIGKECSLNFSQRIGIYNISKTKKDILWFHAVSVGESLSILPIINKLASLNKYQILITTTTVTSANIIKNRINKNIIHQYLPIDKKQYVINFLKYFKPKIGIIAESELWPNLIDQCNKHNIPLILLNGRISKRNHINKIIYNFFATKLLAKFSLILTQSEKEIEKFQNLGLKNIKFIGNLKYDCQELPYSKTQLEQLKKITKNRSIFLAASTHKGEEHLIAQFHHQLRQTLPNLLTIISPRHPNRSIEIEDQLKENMISVSIRSKNEKITDKTDIYLADTLGEMGLFYRLCNIVFIGGSLIKGIGGHNPIEAIRLGASVITGNHIDNANDIYQELFAANAAISISTIEDLESHVINFLNNTKDREKISKNGLKLIKEKSNITQNTINEILNFL